MGSLLIAVALLAAEPPKADLAVAHEVLAGHKGVLVQTLVEGNGTEALRLKEDSLRRFSVARLKRAGVPAVDKHTKETLILTVAIDTVKSENAAVFAFVVRVAAAQGVMLFPSGRFAVGETWSSSRFGLFVDREPTSIRRSVEHCLDQFIADWDKSRNVDKPATLLPPALPDDPFE